MMQTEQQRYEAYLEYQEWLLGRQAAVATELGGTTLAICSLGLADPEAAETRPTVEARQPAPEMTAILGEVSVQQLIHPAEQTPDLSRMKQQDLALIG